MRTNHPAPGGKMPAGGNTKPGEELTCHRCGALATRSWEGREFLQLCDSCHDDLGRWLES